MSARDASGRQRPQVTVGALIRGPTGRVLLVRTHKWRGAWGVPGGKVEYGERLADALRREVREETGLMIADIRWAPVQEAVDSPEFHRPAHFVLLNFVAASTAEAVTLNEEAEAHAWVTPEEALAMRLNAPTRILVRYYLDHGFAGEALEPGG